MPEEEERRENKEHRQSLKTGRAPRRGTCGGRPQGSCLGSAGDPFIMENLVPKEVTVGWTQMSLCVLVSQM